MLRFKNDDGSEFPEWEEKNFLDCISKIVDFRGRTPLKLGTNWNEEKSEYLALSALNVKNGYIDDTIDAHYGNEELYNIWMNGNELYKGQVLFTTEAPMGNVAQVPDDKPYILSQRTVAFVPDYTLLQDDFLAVLLSSSNVQKKLDVLATGGTAKGVSQKSLKSLGVKLPSLPEQQKIAEFLLTIDTVIAKQKETVSAWEERKKGVMQKLFSQEVRFKADDGSEFPEWEEKKLGDVCAPLTYGMNAAAVKYDEKNKYIRITDIDDESHLYKNDELVSPDGELDDKYLVGENDILLARTGASVGKSYLYDKKDGKLYYAGFLIKAHVESENSRFIFYQTLTDRYARWVQVTSMRSGQPGINANEYSEFMVYVPCLAEQQKIADCLSSLDEVIEKQKATLAAWEELKKGLLQQMFV